jgi:hypothetical protein
MSESPSHTGQLTVLQLRVGEVVEILSEAEIRATLDERGMLDNLPFMPEMGRFCGKRFTVRKRAEKLCVEGAFMRRMKDAVVLDNVLCDGSAHDACKRLCTIFWKEAWLRRAPAGAVPNPPLPLRTDFVEPPIESTAEKTYSCQSTNMVAATEHVSAWDVRQYVHDFSSGNFSLWQIAWYMGRFVLDRIQYLRGKPEIGKELGTLTKTPKVSLGLKKGEKVRVKSRADIVATLDAFGRNRGLDSSPELWEFCGREMCVLECVDRIILEQTGKMRAINDTIILEGSACGGMCRRGCARGTYPLWREAWVERV